MENNLTWEEPLKDMHSILVACVGFNFGPNPEKKISEIREKRGSYGWQIIDRLTLNKKDRVLDMGSGCGFIARVIAPHVKEVHCADLNPDFLRYCKKEVAEFKNVHCHAINYADFSALENLKINKVYSTAVWIHFNFYDMVLNLKAINQILPVGGRFYFDYLDAAGIKDGDGRIFQEHLKSYSSARDKYQLLVKYTGTDSMKAAVDLCGFKIIDTFQVWEDCFGAVIEKIITAC